MPEVKWARRFQLRPRFRTVRSAHIWVFCEIRLKWSASPVAKRRSSPARWRLEAASASASPASQKASAVAHGLVQNVGRATPSEEAIDDRRFPINENVLTQGRYAEDLEQPVRLGPVPAGFRLLRRRRAPEVWEVLRRGRRVRLLHIQSASDVVRGGGSLSASHRRRVGQTGTAAHFGSRCIGGLPVGHF